MALFNLRLDATAQTQAAALLPNISSNVTAYNASHPTQDPIVADIGYVYSCAVTAGLSYWRSPSLWGAYQVGPGADVPTVATFTPSAGSGTSTILVSITDNDLARVEAIMAALGNAPTNTAVAGAACCTGLQIMSGINVVRGPWT